jgi:fatty-acyl-CoA synthase
MVRVMDNKNNTYLSKRDANYRPLSPIKFLLRAEDVFPNRIAVIDGSQIYTWKEHGARCRQLASALRGFGIKRGDVVSFLAPNSAAMLEAHFGIPMAGAILNALNVRLDAATIAFILNHSEAKVLFADAAFLKTAKEAVSQLENPISIIVIDETGDGTFSELSEQNYESFLNSGSDPEQIVVPEDEWESISLNYTSGTTGNPKGVLYHHRGTYLNSLSMLLHHHMSEAPVYLWTLPLFHCNGWNFSWAVAAVGGTHVCLRQVSAEAIFQKIVQHKVTHMCCAPTVLSFIIEGAEEHHKTFDIPVNVMTAGAAPPSAIIEKTEKLGFKVSHVYGMTEAHGVAVVCEEQDDWKEYDSLKRAKLMARQGVRTIVTDDVIVRDPQNNPVPHDGITMGEVLLRGNQGMKGYLKNQSATEEAFSGGWYHSGDLAVVHPDGYIELKDRSKDIIISGGENISSIEIEDVLHSHPSVFSVAVVAMPHEKWGEAPCAFIELNPGVDEDSCEEALLKHCKENLAKFKVPKKFVFGPVEKTATGKIQKFKLRNQFNS